MAGGFEKSVNVEDKGDGNFNISYRGRRGRAIRSIAGIVAIMITFGGCVGTGTLAGKDNVMTVVGLWLVLYVFMCLYLIFYFPEKTHTLMLSSNNLEFEGKKIPWNEVDTLGQQGSVVYLVCSGTKINLGESIDENVAKSVMDKISMHSSKRFN